MSDENCGNYSTKRPRPSKTSSPEVVDLTDEPAPPATGSASRNSLRDVINLDSSDEDEPVRIDRAKHAVRRAPQHPSRRPWHPPQHPPLQQTHAVTVQPHPPQHQPRHPPQHPPQHQPLPAPEADPGAGAGIFKLPALDGECETLRTGRIRTWTLRPSRSVECTPAEQHFRFVESAFCRGGGTASAIHAIEYTINPPLLRRWLAKKEKYDQRFGRKNHTILFAFHGTKPGNVPAILRDGFRISMVGSTTDAGFFGRGIYFSEHFGMSAGYNRGNHKMLLCKLLLGKPYNMRGQMQNGCDLKPGYTSHVSDPSGSEVIIFDEAAMLPVCAVSMKANGGARGGGPFGSMAGMMGSMAAGAAPGGGESLKGMGSGGVPPPGGAGLPGLPAGLFGGASPAAMGMLGGMAPGHAVSTPPAYFPTFPGAGHVLGGGGGGGGSGAGGAGSARRREREDEEAELRRVVELSKTEF